jgi:ferrous iron transport protein B
MTLNDLDIGQSGFIVKIKGNETFRHRLMEMGFKTNEKVTLLHKAPLNDPLLFHVMGSKVSLRRSEALNIEITTEEELQELENIDILSTNIEHLISKKSKNIEVALIGNPNSGKTTIFNFASHAHEHVGNYAGVTVDAKSGTIEFRDYKITFVDLPGTYSLQVFSPEEAFVRHYLLQKMPDVIINVIDASNIERNMLLTTQLMELDYPMVIALNMFDELSKKGVKLDVDKLSEMLKIPIIPTVGIKNKGIDELLNAVIDRYESNLIVKSVVHFPLPIENCIEKIQNEIAKTNFTKSSISSRFIAIKLLEKDPEFLRLLKRNDYISLRDIVEKSTEIIEKEYNQPSEFLFTDIRYGFIKGALRETLSYSQKDADQSIDKLDKILTHKIWGIPIFLAFLYIMFFSTFYLGSYLQNWMELGIDWIKIFLSGVLRASLFKDLLIDGVITGVGSVLVFLPNIVILFLFIAFMEDTGYLSRVAFLMDKLMHRIGLHGKSFIPMIMGFGCNVPAIMSSRILENPSDRKITILINPFFSCNARLAIYVLIINIFFPNSLAYMPFILYLTGVLIAAIVAIIFRKFLFAKEASPFVMELPPYRMPTFNAIIKHMWFRASMYLKKIGTTIFIASIAIWFLSHFPKNNEKTIAIENQIANISHTEANTPLIDSLQNQLVHEQISNSYLAKISIVLEPIFKPLGYDWHIISALITGIVAKELIVSTLSIVLPTQGTIANIISPPAAAGLLFFALLYCPCIATLSSIKKETGSTWWAVFAAIYTTLIAYGIALLVKSIFSLVL